MRDPEIQTILEFAWHRFGQENVTPYGCDFDDPHGVCFKVSKVPATFSIHTQEGVIKSGMIDFQVEGFPPGEYLVSGVAPVPEFLSFLTQITTLPTEHWPAGFA